MKGKRSSRGNRSYLSTLGVCRCLGGRRAFAGRKGRLGIEAEGRGSRECHFPIPLIQLVEGQMRDKTQITTLIKIPEIHIIKEEK